jgi:hypothetical protein
VSSLFEELYLEQALNQGMDRLAKHMALTCPVEALSYGHQVYTLDFAEPTQGDRPLAHGSIIAREYGIPAVLGTGNGTQRIRTGERITVNGDTGEVTLPGRVR